MAAERPEISDPAVVGRLSLDPPEFHDFALAQAAKLAGASFRDARLHRAYSYPYERLGFSFLVTPGRVFPIVEASYGSALDTRVVFGEEVVRAADLGDITAAPGKRTDEPERFPLLSYGANVSIEGISGKINGLTGHDSILPVISGDLLDFDVTYSPHLAFYGSLPSTIHPCDGCRSPVAVLMATAAQITAIARLEVNYRFGWLAGARFVDSSREVSGDLYAFVSRHGSFSPDGRPLALSAVKSDPRVFPAVPEKGALGIAAGMLDLGSPEDLVYRTIEDYEWAVRQRPTLAARSTPFESPSWVDFGTERGDSLRCPT